MIRIHPKYKILISYDILPESQEVYYRFVTTEFVPGLRDLKLYMIDVHQTMWGDYPLRLAEFVAESLEIVREAFASDKFRELEEKFLQYTTNYSRKVIPYRGGFQL
ncbi:MAG: hypothetical protein GYB66_06425 [Chloroflexi bacterium]|nr:hypothetical protein [Chloroflexota bacterium]